MTDPIIHISFTKDEAGILHAPAGSTVTLAPMGGLAGLRGYYRIAITLPSGDEVSCVVAAIALKITPAKRVRP
jgi:hypothetical protein